MSSPQEMGKGGPTVPQARLFVGVKLEFAVSGIQILPHNFFRKKTYILHFCGLMSLDSNTLRACRQVCRFGKKV